MKERLSPYERLTIGIGRLVTAYPGKITLVFVLLTILLTIPLKDLDTSTKMSDFFPESEFIEADETMRNEFNSTFSIACTLRAGSGNILDREGLSTLWRMERTIVSSEKISPFLIDYEDPVITIAGAIESALRSQSDGALGIDNAPEPMFAAIVNGVLEDDVVSGLVSQGETPERKYAIILIRLDHNMIEKEDETIEIELIEIIEDRVPAGYYFTSFSAKNHNMQKDSRESLGVLMPISMILVIMVLLVSLRSIVRVLVSLVGLAGVIIMSFGLFSLLDMQFSQMMFFAPIIIMVLSIDYAIHIYHRYDEYRNEGMDTRRSMAMGIRFIGISILLSTITTAFAFASNGLSNIPAVASFGLFLAMGISISFFVMTLLIPSLMIIINSRGLSKPGRPDGSDENITEKDIDIDKDKGKGKDKGTVTRFKTGYNVFVRSLVNVSHRYWIIIILVALLLSGGGLYLGTLVEKDMSPKDAMAKDSSVAMTVDILNDHFPQIGMETAYIMIEGDICEPVVFEALDRAITNMGDDEHVAKGREGPKIISVLPYVRAVARSVDNGSGSLDLNTDGIPDTREGMIMVLDRLYAEGIPGVVSSGKIRSLLSKGEDGRPYDMLVITAEAYHVEGLRGGELLKELKEDLVPVMELDHMEISYAGYVFERYQMMKEMTDGMIVSTFVSIVAITFVVILLFRSARFGLITALPIILVVGWILGSMYFLEFTLNMVTATITSFTVGIGIDYNIHLVERYRQEKRTGLSDKRAMRRSIETTGFSLLAAGMTTFSGFFVMVFSKIGMFHSFGILASLMIVFAVISSILVLPAMLLGSGKVLNRKGKKTGPIKVV